MLYIFHYQQSKLSSCSASTTHLGMLRVGRMIRVLRRLSELRHVDVIGPLGVAWVDVIAWDSSGLLDGFVRDFS